MTFRSKDDVYKTSVEILNISITWIRPANKSEQHSALFLFSAIHFFPENMTEKLRKEIFLRSIFDNLLLHQNLIVDSDAVIRGRRQATLFEAFRSGRIEQVSITSSNIHERLQLF